MRRDKYIVTPVHGPSGPTRRNNSGNGNGASRPPGSGAAAKQLSRSSQSRVSPSSAAAAAASGASATVNGVRNQRRKSVIASTSKEDISSIPPPPPPPPPNDTKDKAFKEPKPNRNDEEDTSRNASEQQEATKLSSLTYENLEASSGRLSSLLSTGSGEDTGTTGTNEYYEEVDFRNGVASKAASATKRENSSEITVEYDDDDKGSYEDVVVTEEPSRSGSCGSNPKYSYNNPDYENVERSSAKNRGLSRNGSVASSSGSQFESMFGIARRFPSIRLKGGAKKEAKKAALQASDESDFPRNGGNTIPINFGQSLEALYSKPSSAKKRKANTILPVMSRNADTAEQVINGESGSCYKPVTALYKSRTPSLSTLASLKQSMSSTLSLNRNSSSSSAESHSDNFAGQKYCCPPRVPCPTWTWPARKTGPTAPEAVTVDEGDEVPRKVEDVLRRDEASPRKKISTSFLCAVIALSIIAFIVAGAVLLYQYLSGDVITLTSGGVASVPNPAPPQNGPWQRATSTLPVFPRAPGFIRPGGDVATTARSPQIANYSGPNWAPWSAWSSCSSQCLRGESQARHRACLDAEGSTAEVIKPCIERGRKANVDIRLCACNRTKNGWRRSGMVSAEDGDAVRRLLQNQEGDEGKTPDPV